MSFVSTFTYPKMNIDLEMLTAREQLMEDIDCIIESKYALLTDIDGVDHHTIEVDPDELVRVLCDAVCRNFPTK